MGRKNEECEVGEGKFENENKSVLEKNKILLKAYKFDLKGYLPHYQEEDWQKEGTREEREEREREREREEKERIKYP